MSPKPSSNSRIETALKSIKEANVVEPGASLLDYDELLGSLPGLLYAMADSVGRVAERLGSEFPVQPAVTEHLQEIAAKTAGCAEFAIEACGLFWRDHAEELERLEAARPAKPDRGASTASRDQRDNKGEHAPVPGSGARERALTGYNVIQPMQVEPWAGPMYRNLRDIEQLGINDQTYHYVSIRQVAPITADESIETVGLNSVTVCSGILMNNLRNGDDLAAHLLEDSEDFLIYMDEHPCDDPRDMVFMYGDQSTSHPNILDAVMHERYGPINLHFIAVPSGNAPWGMVYYRNTGQVKVLIRRPQSILTYQVFPLQTQ
jgi:hypothetical protein